MTRRNKIRIDTSPVAQRYADERVIEVSDDQGRGCLVSFKTTDDGLVIEIYRADPGIIVRAPEGSA